MLQVYNVYKLPKLLLQILILMKTNLCFFYFMASTALYLSPLHVTLPVFSPEIINSFQGKAWISLVSGGGRWEIRMAVNLTLRNDTGKLNTSPISAMTPIVRLQHGCNHTIVIPGKAIFVEDMLQ